MSAQLKPIEARYVDVKFRSQTYRVTVDHAHMLAKRGHLRAYRFGGVRYEVEDDRMISVSGDPLPSSGQGGSIG